LKGVREGIGDTDDVAASRFGIFLNILLPFWESSCYQHRSIRRTRARFAT